MTEQALMESAAPSPTLNRVVSLWTPKNIFWLGLVFGWPSALVLCIINWLRMGLWKKALFFALGGLVGLVLFLVFSAMLPENTSRFPMLVINISLLASFQALMNMDFVNFGYPNANYKHAGVGWGILVCLAALVIWVVSAFVVFFVIEMISYILAPTPITPLPGQTGWQGIPFAGAFFF